MLQGLEPEEFWDYLGGEPENPIPVSPIPISHSYDPYTLSPCLQQREDVYVPRRPILYRVGLGTGYLELPQGTGHVTLMRHHVTVT